MARKSGIASHLLIAGVLLAAMSGLSLLVFGCGAALTGSGGSQSSSVSTSSTEVTTTLSAPPSSLSTTTVVTPPEKLPALSLGDVAYVDLSRSTLSTVDSGDRRILSPADDAADIQALLDAYSQAAIVPDNGFRQDQVDLIMVVHLLDGSALTIFSRTQDPQSCLMLFSDGNPANTDNSRGELSNYAWSRVVSAPKLFPEIEWVITETKESGKSASLPATMPKDFGMVAAFGVDGKMVLDTFAGTFHKDMILPPGTTTTASLRLTPAELEQAYVELVAMDILAYPTDFVPKPDMGVTPNESYYLRIKVGSTQKEIRWNDSSLSLESRAKALRGWFKKLADLIYAKPEYGALPAFRGGYA